MSRACAWLAFVSSSAAFQLTRVPAQPAAIRSASIIATEAFAPTAEILAAQKGASKASRALAEAVAREDYAAAAKWSLQLKGLRNKDPLIRCGSALHRR